MSNTIDEEFLIMKKLALLTVALVGLSVSASANLVVNGGFEQNDWNYSGSYKKYNAGSNGITGWSIGLRSVDLVQSPYPVLEGRTALDLAGTPGPGSISQNLNSVQGTKYVVSFWALTRENSSAVNQYLFSTFGDQSLQFNLSGTYTKYSYVATAIDDGYLSFATDSLNTTTGNILIDDVSVEAVPEPASMAALAFGAIALLKRRKKA